MRSECLRDAGSGTQIRSEIAGEVEGWAVILKWRL